MEFLNMDKRLKISKLLIRYFIFMLLTANHLLLYKVNAFGYDSANACSPNGKISRKGRAQLIATIPCDLSSQAFCNLPGSAYPWHAVRRFVHENQGLMKRMYGDIRHISILRDEIQNNEIDIEDVEVAAARYSKDGRRSSKFMHIRDDYGGIRNNDVLKEPHFRPVSTTPSSSSVSSTTTKLNNSNEEPSNVLQNDTLTRINDTLEKSEDSRISDNELQETLNVIDVSVESEEFSNEDDLDGDDENLESNSVYGLPTSPSNDLPVGENIQMVEPPKFGNGLNNLSEVSTISTTLKKVSNSQILHNVNSKTRNQPQDTQRQRPAAASYNQYQYQHYHKQSLPHQQLYHQQHQQHHHQQQQQQQNPPLHQTQDVLSINKVNITFLNESSNLKFNESERFPSSTTSTTFSAAIAPSSSTSSQSTSTPTAEDTKKPTTANLVKGALTITHLKSSTNKINNTLDSNNTNKTKFNNNDMGIGTETTTTKSSTGSSASESASSSTSPESAVTTSATLSVNVSIVTTSSSTALPASTLSNSNLYHSEKLKRPSPAPNVTFSTTQSSTSSIPSQSPTPAPSFSSFPVTSSPVTKPVLRDGQLFQDTIKQDTQPILNSRGVNACPVKEEVVAPFWANNTRGEVLALLNLYPFEQYVHWEKCIHEHKQMYCRDGCRCEQQYRLHRLLAYDPHNECRGIFSDWFRFPSSCICKCYDIPMDFRATSRSPRSDMSFDQTDKRHPIEIAEEEVKKAIYAHATEDWYRPKDDFDFYEG